MITLCHAMNDAEVMYVRALLQNAEIPFHIVGENFGSLFPGLQIASYNERKFMVPEECFTEASKLVEELRSFDDTATEELNTTSKIRVILETIAFGWSSLGGNKKTASNNPNDTNGSAES